MADSLKLGTLELLAAPYQALAGTDLGTYEPITTSTASLFLDGSVVSGQASGNRVIKLRVQVLASSRTGLAQAADALATQVDKQSNTLTWTPSGGTAMAYDTFRGSVMMDGFSSAQEKAFFIRFYDLELPALPFARSTKSVSPGAVAPAITIADFNGSALTSVAAALTSYPSGYYAPTVASATGSVAVTWSAASNCSLNTTTGLVPVLITSSASGDMEVVTGPLTLNGSSGYFTAATDVAAGGLSTGSPVRQQRLGIDWLDSSGNQIGATEWGLTLYELVQVGSSFWTSGEFSTVHVTALAPASATQARLRLRTLATAGGETHRTGSSVFLSGAGAAAGSVATSSSPSRDGSNSLTLTTTRHYDGNTAFASAYVGKVALSTPADISSTAQLSLYAWAGAAWGAGNGAISVRLFDASGNWSRWDLTPPSGTLSSSTWYQWTASVGSPTISSASGSVDLTAVTAWDLTVVSRTGFTGSHADDNVSVAFDDLIAGAAPSSSTSSNGTVFNLSDIKGSARSSCSVRLDRSGGMGDFLLYSAPSDEDPTAPCLLALASNVVTTTAPTKLRGVYEIIVSAAAATTTTPTLQVQQKQAGTVVATKTLTAAAASSAKYVDFGPLALPLVDVPDDNTGVTYTFTMTAPTSGSWTDVLVLNTRGNLAWAAALAASKAYVWVDAPKVTTGLGAVYAGAASDRSDAASISDVTTLSGPGLTVKAPQATLLAYSTSGAPGVQLTYYPHWLTEPTS